MHCGAAATLLAVLIGAWPVAGKARSALTQCGSLAGGSADSLLFQLTGPLYPSAEYDTLVYRGAPYPTFEQDVAVFHIVSTQGHGEPIDTLLRAAVIDFGGPDLVGKSLLRIASMGMPYGADARLRAEAAYAYGLLHRAHPDEVRADVLPALLTAYYVTDDVKVGLARASILIEENNPDLDKALSIELCRALVHLRPFVISEQDIDHVLRISWYDSALALAGSTARALMHRHPGRDLLKEQIEREPNEVLASLLTRIVEGRRR